MMNIIFAGPSILCYDSHQTCEFLSEPLAWNIKPSIWSSLFQVLLFYINSIFQNVIFHFFAWNTYPHKVQDNLPFMIFFKNSFVQLFFLVMSEGKKDIVHVSNSQCVGTFTVSLNWFGHLRIFLPLSLESLPILLIYKVTTYSLLLFWLCLWCFALGWELRCFLCIKKKR